jgi:hypothetical protein
MLVLQKPKGASLMAFLTGSSHPPTFPSGRYTYTNPLRREAGLRLLTGPLPERLRWAIIHTWRHPSPFEVGMTALPHLHRQRPDEARLLQASPSLIVVIALTEMEVSRRVVEAPQVNLKPAERDSLLFAQGQYLGWLYAVLARQVGEAAALAEFERLVLQVG